MCGIVTQRMIRLLLRGEAGGEGGRTGKLVDLHEDSIYASGHNNNVSCGGYYANS